MFAITTELLLRIAGLCVLLISLAVFTYSPVSHTAIEWLRALLCVTTFAVCFWLSTRQVPAKRETSLCWFLLVAQSISGMAFSTTLLYVVAIEAPLLLTQRHAIQYLAAQIISYATFWPLVKHLGLLKINTVVNGVDYFYIELFANSTWQFFSFLAGWFTANEARSRQQVVQLNAELLIAQLELAENSRAEERLRISRELHDAVGHQLVALTVQLDVASRVPEPAKAPYIATAHTLAKQMLNEVRSTVSALRDKQEDDLKTSLAKIIATIPEPEIHLSISCEIDKLNAAYAQNILRCIQEAITNSVKHGHAANLWIDFTQRDTQLLLTIHDDGIGQKQVSEGNGLQGMRERLAQMGGNLTIRNQGDTGFTLEIAVPFQEMAA